MAMKTDELNYELPSELIAQEPSEHRSESRLLVLDRSDKSMADKVFSDIIDYLKPGDCLVVNNTKVLPARFYAKKQTGARLEGLFLNTVADGWEVMLKNSRKLKPGEDIILLDTSGGEYAKVSASLLSGGKWKLGISASPEEVLSKIGYAPLPPYIKRDAQSQDRENDLERYQTVFATETGAVAAPTAGLHFTRELLEKIKERGILTANVTLHVGAGTFKPVTSENLLEHDIHSERYCVDQANADIINIARKNGGRIIAVGTTSVRTLETIAENGRVEASCGDTKLFIMPGYEYKIVDAMITNFHLPKSTLLALVGAFAGMDYIFEAYKHAIENRYRFFSYGDAMLIL